MHFDNRYCRIFAKFLQGSFKGITENKSHLEISTLSNAWRGWQCILIFIEFTCKKNPLKASFWDNSEICLLFSRNNNKYLSYIVENIIFGFSIPD